MINKITHVCENVYDVKWNSGTVIGIYDKCFNIITDSGELLTFFKKGDKYSTRALITDIEQPIPTNYLYEGAKATRDGPIINVGKLIFDAGNVSKLITAYSPVKVTRECSDNMRVFSQVLDKHRKNSPIFENGIVKEKLTAGINLLGNNLVSGFDALVGMGIGLTPSCDDVLAGMSAWFHLTDTGHGFNKALAEFLQAKGDAVTTTVSKNLLSDSANGYINKIVYDVINSILTNKDNIEKYTLELIDYGSTSGSETCAGILEGYKLSQKKEQIKWL